jgi:hypothetical protein
MFRACIVLVASLVLSLPAGAVELLLPGQYHGDEIGARDRETWTALVRQDDGSLALEHQEVAITAVNDPVLDDADGFSGKQVAADRDGVLFFVRGLPLATLGPIDAAYAADGSPAALVPGFEQRFVLAGRDAGRLQLSCSGEGDTRDCGLQYEHDGRRQTLAQWTGTVVPGSGVTLGDDAFPHLRWAGDLDRDGALDLLIDTSDHYNVSRPTLFLSSQAARGQLVLRAATLESVGC